VLPAQFPGGVRNMQKSQLRSFGKPSFFMTFTANSNCDVKAELLTDDRMTAPTWFLAFLR
jgi:hypothetical protein